MAPSCTLRIETKGEWKRSKRNDISSKNFHFPNSGDGAVKKPATDKKPGSKIGSDESKPLHEEDQDWIGLKLLFRFLERFRRYTISSKADSECHIVSMTSSQRDHLMRTHKNIFFIICKLIALSPTVCHFVLNVPGAMEIIKKSRVLAVDSPGIQQVLMQADKVLRSAAEKKAFKAEELRQAMKNLFVNHTTTAGKSPSPMRRPGSGRHNNCREDDEFVSADYVEDDVHKQIKLEIDVHGMGMGQAKPGTSSSMNRGSFTPGQKPSPMTKPADKFFLKNAFFRRLPDKPSLPNKIPMSLVPSIVQSSEGFDPLASAENDEKIRSAAMEYKKSVKKPMQNATPAAARTYSVPLLQKRAGTAPSPSKARCALTPDTTSSRGKVRAHAGLRAAGPQSGASLPLGLGQSWQSSSTTRKPIAGLHMETMVVDGAVGSTRGHESVLTETSLLSKTYPTLSHTHTQIVLDFDMLEI